MKFYKNNNLTRYY